MTSAELKQELQKRRDSNLKRLNARMSARAEEYWHQDHRAARDK